MTVARLFMDGQVFEVTGEGYQPEGDINPIEAVAPAQARRPGGSTEVEPPTGIRELLTVSVLSNGAILQQEDGTWRVLGDPTESALRQTLILSGGSLDILFTRPIAAPLTVIALLLFLLPVVQWARRATARGRSRRAEQPTAA